jgi:hypothetical protein
VLAEHKTAVLPAPSCWSVQGYDFAVDTNVVDVFTAICAAS